jgi:hypothetical protein
MKQKLAMFLCLIGLGLIVALSFMQDSKGSAAKSPDTAIRTTVQSYLNAVNAGDAETMVKYTDDLRFPDKATQIENYKGIKEAITNVSIKSLEKMTETSYKVNISANIQGNQQEFAIPVVNKYGIWLVVIGQPAA